MFLAVCFAFFLILIVLLKLAPLGLDHNFVALILLIDFTLALSFFLIRRKKDYEKSYLRHSVIFLLGFVIVHFQHPLELILTGEVSSNLDIWIDTNVVPKSLTLSSLGFCSYLIGYELYSKAKVKLHEISYKVPDLNSKYLTWLCVIIFLAFLLNANPLYLAGYYGSISPGPTAVYLQFIFEILLFSVIIIKSWNIKNLTSHKITFKQYLLFIGIKEVVLISLYFALLLFIGDRGPVIGIGLLVLGGYAFYKKTWPKPYLLLIMFFSMAFVMTLIGVIRSFDKDLDFGQRVSEALNTENETSTLENTSELAGSIRTLHYAVSYVPSKYDFTYGRFQIQQLITTVPGVGSLLTYVDNRYQYKGSASFITYLEQGSNPTSGLGTSVIADFYIDFGAIGVILGMFLLGIFMRKFELIAFGIEIPSLLLWVITMVYFSRSIYIGRSSALFFIKESIWIYAVIILNQFILTGRRWKKRG